MLALDREQKRGAIQLYVQIIGIADQERDDVTIDLFRRILSDEEKHHRLFSDLFETD